MDGKIKAAPGGRLYPYLKKGLLKIYPGNVRPKQLGGMVQEELARANKIAWETKAYKAWVQQHGTPEQLAEHLKLNHRHHLRYWSIP